MRIWPGLLGAAALLAGCTTTRHFAQPGYSAAPVKVLVMRPDVEVGSLGIGGVPQPNADWTAAARDALGRALADSEGARGVGVAMLSDQSGEAAKLVGDYTHLHRAVATAIAEYKYDRDRSLPTKKGRFDWTLGPGAARLAALSPGATHALFLYSRDYFATGGRKAVAVAGAVGCAFGFCVFPQGGEHLAYASLVDLRTGDVVWFDVLSGSGGDVRDPAGARAAVDRLLRTLPGPRS